MKKLYISLFLLILCFSATAQIVAIPDANFKAALLEPNPELYHAYDIDGNYIDVDANNDGEIQLSEALAVYGLNLQALNITTLSGIQSFSNLEVLDVNYNQLTSLNLAGMANLYYVWASENNMTSLILTGCTQLMTIQCDFNQLTSLDLSGLTNLETAIAPNNMLTSVNVAGLANLSFLTVSSNELTTIDVSGCPNLGLLDVGANNLTSLDLSSCHPEDVYVDENPLTTLYLKNGFDDSNSNITIYDVPIEYICTDEFETQAFIDLLDFFSVTNCAVNSYCSFVPGGTYYTVSGINRFDADNDGCGTEDPIYPNLKFSITDSNSVAGTFISNASGGYSIALPEGVYTITPVFENPTYFTTSPSVLNVVFPSEAGSIVQDFCIAPVGSSPDLEILLLPLTQSVPGFEAEYKLMYKNKGNVLQSGLITVAFDNALQQLVVSNPAATQTGNTLIWNFANLLPSESREIFFTLHVNAPTDTPPVNIGDVLSFTAGITSDLADMTMEDNTSQFDAVVVGSFDPNDKTCLEGDVVSTAVIGEYVHYLIRFENTGTFPAQNIVVRDVINTSRFDVSTLVPTGASHSFVTRITDVNKVEFIFEDIELPFDDANNDGYVSFKIKTRPNLVAGNTFTNSASIYFDFNFPILTNTAATTIQALGVSDFEFSKYFVLYPNPAGDVLHIAKQDAIAMESIEIYNILGQLVIAVPNAQTVSSIDVDNLKAGHYFIKINSDKGITNAKFVKN